MWCTSPLCWKIRITSVDERTSFRETKRWVREDIHVVFQKSASFYPFFIVSYIQDMNRNSSAEQPFTAALLKYT